MAAAQGHAWQQEVVDAQHQVDLLEQQERFAQQQLTGIQQNLATARQHLTALQQQLPNHVHHDQALLDCWEWDTETGDPICFPPPITLQGVGVQMIDGNGLPLQRGSNNILKIIYQCIEFIYNQL